MRLNEEDADEVSLPLPKGPFEALLPPNFGERGGLIEWLAEGGGHGALWLACKLAAESLPADAALVVVDPSGEFYPPVVAGLGMLLQRLILLRPRSHADVLWGLEQSLRCAGVAGVVCRLGKLDSQSYRRLQLAVEQGGGLGMLVRGAEFHKEPSWADVRLRVSACSGAAEGNASEGRRWHIEVLHCRVGTPGAAVDLEISDDPVCVRLVPRLAPAKALRGAAGA